MTQHIIIAGGGPTGLLTALGLAQAGSRITVLEAEEAPNNSPRALVYHFPVLPHLRRLGILEDCINAGLIRQDFAWRIHATGEMIFWDLGCLADEVELPHALHLGQDKLSAIILAHLRKLDNVQVLYSHKLVGVETSGDGVRATVDVAGRREVIDGQWLIGADGARSVVRRGVLKLNFFGVTWPQRYVATNTRFDFDSLHFGRTTMQVDDTYGSVICKIDNENLWRVTFMEDPSLPLETLPARIDDMFGKLLPTRDAYEVVATSPYHMHQRVADRMRVGRVLLVGDAAHVTNPTGGLGLTGGMFDTFALVEALNDVIHNARSQDVLDEYDRDRRQKFVELVSPRATQNLHTLYHMKPGVQKDEWVAETRRIARDRHAMKAALRFTECLQTTYS